jgi:hypothetical protein
MFHERSRDITIAYFCASTQGRVWDYARGHELVRQMGAALFELAVEQSRTQHGSSSTRQALGK